ncbi:MAG: type II secretion system protein [Armatimonadota bacterium]
MQFYRSGQGERDVRPSHTGGEPGELPGGHEAAWTRRWLTAAKFLVAPVIILIVVAILLPALLQARQPTYETRCMAKLRELAAAIDMYTIDHDAGPLPGNWHEAIWPYISNPQVDEARVEPGGRLDPRKCPSDPTDSTVSYLYLDRGLLSYSKAHVSEGLIPLAVDEYFHPHVTLAYYDGHVEKIEKQLWLHQRNRQWEIRRDLEHAASFAYEPVPGSLERAPGPAPEIERTERYIWPEF